MNFKKEDLTQMDTAINCLRFDDIAYYKISKELTKKFFLENKLIPRDHFGKENEDYESGEIQICFNRDENMFSEALIAPVYEDYGGLVSGDVYSISDMISENIIDMAKSDLSAKGEKA